MKPLINMDTLDDKDTLTRKSAIHEFGCSNFLYLMFESNALSSFASLSKADLFAKRIIPFPGTKVFHQSTLVLGYHQIFVCFLLLTLSSIVSLSTLSRTFSLSSLLSSVLSSLCILELVNTPNGRGLFKGTLS